MHINFFLKSVDYYIIRRLCYNPRIMTIIHGLLLCETKDHLPRKVTPIFNIVITILNGH